MKAGQPAESRACATLWVGNHLGPYEWLCLSSFVAAGQELHLFSYSSFDVPTGVVPRDANEVMPASQVFDNPIKPGSYALFSNFFRYEMVLRESLIWVDTDIFCLKPFSGLGPFIFGYEEPMKLNGAVLSYPNESAFGVFLLAEAKRRLASGPVRWGDVGPNLVTRAVDEFELWNNASSRPTFYPVHYLDVWKFFDPRAAVSIDTSSSESYCVHLWSEYLSGPGGALKSSVPEKSSWLYERFRELDLLSQLEGRSVVNVHWARGFWRRRLNRPKKRLRKNILFAAGLVHGAANPKLKSRIQALRRRFRL